MNDKIYSRSRIRLPKIELKNKENNRNTIKILKIIVILGIAINFAYFSLKGIKPIMEKNCIGIAKSAATKVSNIKATEVMAKYEYDDILNIIKDENGNIKMVGTNIFTVNKIISDIPVYMQEEFEREEKKLKLDDEKEIKLHPIKGDVKQQTAKQKQSELTKVVELIPDRISVLNNETNKILKWTKEKFSVEGNLPNIKIDNFDTNSFYHLSTYHNTSIYKNGGIVFCPHRTHLFGVTDKFKFDKYDDDIRDEEGNIIHRRGDFVLDQNGNKVKLPLPKRKAVADSLTKTGK